MNGLLARGAAEVARRSPVKAGREALAKHQGFLNPARLIASVTGGSISTASRFVSVGQATATRRSLTSMLDRVSRRADPAHADAYERFLADKAAAIPLETLFRLIKEVEARLDQDGVQPREEELHEERAVYLREDGHGMLHLTAHLDPESAAPVKAAIEAIVTHTLRTRRDHEKAPADGDGVGHGTIDGLTQPVSASTIRKLAASAGIISAVLGGDSLPLDVGRTARLFTPAQRIALGETAGSSASTKPDWSGSSRHPTWTSTKNPAPAAKPATDYPKLIPTT